MLSLASAKDDPAHTLLVHGNDMSHICHIDATFQLKTWLPPHIWHGFFFSNNKFGLLFIWVDIFATKKDLLKKIHVVLYKAHP